MRRLFALLLLIFQVIFLYSQQLEDVYMFYHISTTDGLSNDNTKAVFRDNRGYLWVSNESGLDKWDGYNFQHYSNSELGIKKGSIIRIFEDPEGSVWLKSSTSSYIIYDIYSGKYDKEVNKRLEKLGFPKKEYLGINANQRGEFWVYTSDKLYYRDTKGKHKVFNLKSGDFVTVCENEYAFYIKYRDDTIYRIDKKGKYKPSIIQIPLDYSGLTTIVPYADKSDRIWLRSDSNRLIFYNRTTKLWREIQLGNQDYLTYNRIQSLLDDGTGKLWILTSHEGIFLYDFDSEKMINFRHNSQKRGFLSSNNLNNIFRDNEGNIWLSNFKKGITYYSPKKVGIQSDRANDIGDVVSVFDVPEHHATYFGTDGKGLVKLTYPNMVYEQIPTQSNIILDIDCDNNGELWMGSWHNGLLHLKDGKCIQYTTRNSGINQNDVYSIAVDNKGLVWIGMLNGSIQYFDPKSDTFITIDKNREKFSVSDFFKSIDSERVYVAGKAFLGIINTQKRNMKFIPCSKFGDSDVLTGYHSTHHLVWIGTSNGLVIWDEENDRICHITTKNGLSANLVRCIIEDEYRQMWVATENGVTCIKWKGWNDYETESFKVRDGLLSNEANIHAVHRLLNGWIILGTPEGIEMVIPRESESQIFNAKAYLTSIDTFNQTDYSTYTDGHSLDSTNNIYLDYKQHTVRLFFSALRLIESDKFSYAYSLDESEYLPASRNTVDLNLSNGNHKLSVKVCNSRGQWSDEIRTIFIYVKPPWWASWWAYLIYIGIFAFIIFIISRYFISRSKDRAQIREMEDNAQRERKISEMKLQFFANISHDLRTPLSMIISPLEEFMKDNPHLRSNILEIARNNSRYLLELINQLLDFRRLDAQAEVLRPKNDNILILLMESFHQFDYLAQKNNMEYRLNCQVKNLFMDFDNDKVRKVMYNILSNAFKFTPEGGIIEVSVNKMQDELEVSISDSGNGISDEDKQHIFERFYQPRDMETPKGGSGIGLHIASQYVEMHGGKIRVSDNTPKGTIFSFSLPYHQHGMMQEMKEIIEDDMPIIDESNNKVTLLVIDDNHDIVEFVLHILDSMYNVKVAYNGKQALELLEKEDIDLVISDIMMPEMDGLELCRTIKESINLSHIPVVLLTAKTGEEHQIEGLSYGADDYISKPFNSEILKMRIAHLLELTEKRKKDFDEQIVIEPSRIAVTSMDQKFIAKLVEVVEQNMKDSEFNTEELASAMNMSRSHLYRKITKLTGKNSTDFIRIMRLKRSVQLLDESQMQISEIAYSVGYNLPKVFSKHFKDEYGLTPSEYVRQRRNTSLETNVDL